MKKGFAGFFILVFYALIFAQSSCPNDTRFSEIDYFSTQEVDSLWDVHYGTALNEFGVEEDLYLDLYFPKNAIDPMLHRPTVILIHGGSFVAGDKSNLRYDCKEFAKKGFVCATINYRLGTSSSVTTQYRATQDAFAALRFLAHQASIYHIDPNSFFVGGVSAGSVITLNMTFVTPAEWNLVSPNIASNLGELHNSGNTYTDSYSILGLYNNAGGAYEPFIQGSEMIPAINFHGALDPIVPIDGTSGGFIGLRSLYYLYNNAGICSEMIVDPVGGHVLYSYSISEIQFRVNKTSCFFRNILCQTCTDLYTTSPDTAHCGMDLNTSEVEFPEFKIGPNPFTNHLTIFPDDGVKKVEIYTEDGKKIMSIPSLKNVSLEFLKPGYYFLKIYENESSKTISVLKK